MSATCPVVCHVSGGTISACPAGKRGGACQCPGGFGEWFGSAVWLWRGCAPGRLRAAIDLGRSPLLADLAWRLVSGLRERGRFTPAFPLTWGGSFLDSGGRLSAGPTRTEGCSGKASMRQCGADSGRSGFTYLGYLPTYEGESATTWGVTTTPTRTY